MRVMPDDFELLVDAVNALRVGPSLARVVDNQSPQGRPGWLLIEPVSTSSDGLGSASGQQSWARPSTPLAGPNSNFHMVPDVDALVWIEHIGGEEGQAVWIGCAWPRNHAIDTADADPQQKFIRIGPMEVRFDEGAGELKLVNGQASITLGPDKVTINASTIELTSKGRTVKLDAGGLDALSGALKVM